MKQLKIKSVLAVLVALCSLNVYAYDVEIDGIYYNLDAENKTAEVTNGDDRYTGDIVIPESIEDDGVTYSVTSIGDYAFRYCTSLTSITIPNGVKSIKVCAFEYCFSLTSITIPDGVTSIGADAFRSCKGLTSITLGNSITSIHDDAFRECSSLTSVTIPNSVTDISWYTFYDCPNLTSVTINSNSIVASNISSLVNVFGKQVENYIIGEGVTEIGDNAFYSCNGLKSVVIPNSMTTIGENAFMRCVNLESVTIPNSVTNIAPHAFEGCSSLVAATLSDNLTSIEAGMFLDCGSLTSIAIPNSVTHISNHAFTYCSGLTSITIGDNVKNIGDYAFALCSNLTSVALPNSVTDIEAWAFYMCTGLTSISLGDKVTNIGSNAFRDCSNLKSITIPNSVTYIEQDAFKDCSSLTSVTIGDNLKFISEHTFDNCSSLESITISGSVTSIGTWAFEGCTSLTQMLCYATIPPTCYYGYMSFKSFKGVDPSTCIIQVPKGCSKFYQQADGWKEFSHIEEMEPEPDSFHLSTYAIEMYVNMDETVEIYNGSGEYEIVKDDSFESSIDVAEQNDTWHIKGLTAGNAELKLKDMTTGEVLSLYVSILQPSSLSLDKESLDLNVDESGNVEILTGSAWYEVMSDNPQVATAKELDSVGEEATFVEITALSAGHATITIKDLSSLEEKTVSVTVTDESDAIEDLKVADGNYQICTIDGKPVSTLQKGVNILHMKDGKTKKVLVK